MSNQTTPDVQPRAAELLQQANHRQYASTDRLFAILMVVQWIGGIGIALVISPRTWQGAESQPHVHLIAAALLGGIISSAPIALAILRPGKTVTRQVIAIAQISWSSLAIHLMGGRLETHFHVFGSLAFLAMYRDWRVLMTATVVTAADHYIRGAWWPESIYGVVMTSPYRWLEHSAWVIFEDVFLIVSCRQSMQETKASCEARAELELTKTEIEHRVSVRTSELQDARALLAEEFDRHKETQLEREKLFSDLASASRHAGMAEVATGVLHNVGNVLNSVNISCEMLGKVLRNSRTQSLAKLSNLLNEHRDDLPSFVASEPAGKMLPDFMSKLSDAATAERDTLDSEVTSLRDSIEHIKQIIATQQSYASSSCILEPIRMELLLKDAIKINESSLQRHDVNLDFETEDTPEIMSDKHQLLQILVNLIKNASQAVQQGGAANSDQRVRISLQLADEDNISVKIADNGIGIPDDVMQKLFTHGFTTKPDGHGFGLHSAALSIKELGGTLTAESDGVNQGATFILTIPTRHPTPNTSVAHSPA
ncbi:signal transduction histidine kinase [Rhodopirellula rubra]|uniref:histidine kinase n=1 Tax=Aporhodopirellula rubra TaxID=980271 RepID=A0A7W5E4P0_9BACT|nr:ATP-binding protein [Aporhodopirellula rubra]MBB3210075.1 signal transduction histidine kinase [Aporhodopirellula rubra]